MKITRYVKQKNQTKNKPPKIGISQNAFNKLAQYSTAKSIEIMLLGVVEKLKDTNVYLITDVLIPPQEQNSGAFFTTSDEE